MDAPFPDGMMADIEGFFTEDHLRFPGKDLYDEVFATNLFFPLQRKRELRKMIRLAKSIGPKVVMEIGADKGGGVYHWCKCLPTVENVIACEVRGTPYYKAFEKAFPHITFEWVPQSSYDVTTLNELHRLLNDHWKKKIDVLFIDGDKHKFFDDFSNYLGVMSDTGMVFMHDVNETQSPMYKDFYRVKSLGYRVGVYVDTSEVEPALTRQAQGIPAANPHEDWLRYWKGRSCGFGVIYMPKCDASLHDVSSDD